MKVKVKSLLTFLVLSVSLSVGQPLVCQPEDATMAAMDINSLSFSRGVRFMRADS